MARKTPLAREKHLRLLLEEQQHQLFLLDAVELLLATYGVGSEIGRLCDKAQPECAGVESCLRLPAGGAGVSEAEVPAIQERPPNRFAIKPQRPRVQQLDLEEHRELGKGLNAYSRWLGSSSTAYRNAYPAKDVATQRLIAAKDGVDNLRGELKCQVRREYGGSGNDLGHIYCCNAGRGEPR